jgi:hypothetical protein
MNLRNLDERSYNPYAVSDTFRDAVEADIAKL